MTVLLYLGVAALALVSGLTVWELFEARRLEALLGETVSWLHAPSALRRRLSDEGRAAYPAEWHRGIQRLQTMSLVRVLAALAAVGLFGAVIF